MQHRGDRLCMTGSCRYSTPSPRPRITLPVADPTNYINCRSSRCLQFTAVFGFSILARVVRSPIRRKQDGSDGNGRPSITNRRNFSGHLLLYLQDGGGTIVWYAERVSSLFFRPIQLQEHRVPCNWLPNCCSTVLLLERRVPAPRPLGATRYM